MLRLFRSISRGRHRKAPSDADAIWSPFEGSPEISRHRTVGQTLEDDEVNVDDEDAYSPRRPLKTDASYFDRTHRSHQYDDDDEDGDEDEEEIENEDAVDTPLLPIFSAPHLDRLPLYNITHAIRILIVQKCETTLSWDQLRSPQISQFLVKPIQGQIRTNHFNRATLCALIANCLQFHKEGQVNPGNVGVSKTRALISELLAMRLLREFTTHELIDALSYDFDPLQGMSFPAQVNARPGQVPSGNSSDAQPQRALSRSARVSTIEIAIRAEAKRFLAHPLVVQHLEAIWAGNIVFHSEADNLHRKDRSKDEGGRTAGYGTVDHSPSALPADAVLSRKSHLTRTNKKPAEKPHPRRSVTLYDPRDASLFKLSRLRVPRYRQVFSTFSFATMLGLFVAVLYDRSLEITALEILFWFWSIGYMLDEVVGFTEQGFGLYILSFWNAFDLGILLLFATYYCLRLYGIVLAEQGKHRIASVAYDVLASTAILLFPRLFSVLDHYRYFSQLLIAFRMMAQDLIAILVLILISCSGFFVAFTLSFADDNTDANGVAYALFQILMGFTPAAWDKWAGYNMLGKAIMAAFLIICHFLIVTILITVLTNSFTAIVKNAEEEHQFLFAINTISMVKSDALFSYVAPSNIIGWVLSPLRFIIPLRQYVKFNRTIIKATHFPILFAIFLYERMIMARGVFAPTEYIERQPVAQRKPVAFSINKVQEVFSPYRLREPSVMSFNKDRALDEVFRRPFQGDTMRTTTRDMDPDRRTSANVVDNWMQAAENEGGASPPLEQPRSVLERLEGHRPLYRRANTALDRLRMMKRSREFSTATRSVASDPDVRSPSTRRRPHRIEEESEDPVVSTETLPEETDGDGDDENNDDSDVNDPAVGESAISIREPGNRTPAENSDEEGEFFQTPRAGKSPMIHLSPAAKARLQGPPVGSSPSHLKEPHKKHQRNTSTATTLFAPQPTYDSSASNGANPVKPTTSRTPVGNVGATPQASGALAGQRNPKPKAAQQPKARPIMPPRQRTTPNVSGGGMGLTFMDLPRREPSFNARALDLASEIGDNKWGPSGSGLLDGGGISGMPASFSEQMMRERELQRRVEEERRRGEEEEKGMVNRIMLARMHTLEEGFREVLREIKDLSHSRRESEVDSGSAAPPYYPHPVHHQQLLHPQPSQQPKLKAKAKGESMGTSGSASSWQTPNVGFGRIGGNEMKGHRKSPRKGVARRNSKKAGKENEERGEREQELLTGGQSQESVRSVMGVRSHPEQSVEDAEASRPDTARPVDHLHDAERDRGKDEL